MPLRPGHSTWPARAPPPERLLDLDRFAAKGPRAASFNEARSALRAAALEELAAADRELLQELLVRFADAYAEAKERESALDFEDLQLRARDLLHGHPEIREREQLRFRSIMVDEFQDTNRLQCELIDVLAAGPDKDVFVVGDEFQSIYGFRHADVAVFRERRAAAPDVLPLTLNYRSRPEVLAAVNELFGEAFGDGFRPLEPVAGYGDPAFGTPVELLVTDKSSYADSGTHWRRAEARHVARRVRELVDAGAATPGEIVLLFAAGTDAEWFEQELREVGLPTYRMTGRRYFGQQQVVDLLSYLRLLHNRYDDDALLTVLASPFVGVSNDALVLIRAAAARRPIFRGIENTPPPDLPDVDRRLVRAFLQRYERLVEASGQLSLELLCERIAVEHDYDLAVLARRDGRRRYANMRKLARLARSYEELRGPDIEGFVRFVGEQETAGARELDAVSEEEGADAVRLLTIHAAKGLEFKVVVVADAGRERAGVSEILCLSDGRFGFKVAHPATGSRVGTTSYEHVKDAHEQEEAEERLRLYYVAMTRAMERLIVSGSVDLGGGKPEPTPISWVLDRLDLREAIAGAAAGPVEVTRGTAGVVARLDAFVESADGAPGAATRRRSRRGTSRASSPSSRAAARRCRRRRRGCTSCSSSPSLRRTASRGSRTARSRSSSGARTASTPSVSPACARASGRPPTAAREGSTRPRSATRCTALLEAVDLAHPELAPAAELGALVRGWYPQARDDELTRIAELAGAYVDSELAARIASLPGAAAERPFAFEHDGVLLNGRLDVMWAGDGRALVLDYKTNALLGRDPSAIVEDEYTVQRLVYALACLRAGLRRGRGRLPVPRGSRRPGVGDLRGPTPCRRSRRSSRP